MWNEQNKNEPDQHSVTPGILRWFRRCFPEESHKSRYTGWSMPTWWLFFGPAGPAVVALFHLWHRPLGRFFSFSCFRPQAAVDWDIGHFVHLHLPKRRIGWLMVALQPLHSLRIEFDQFQFYVGDWFPLVFFGPRGSVETTIFHSSNRFFFIMHKRS